MTIQEFIKQNNLHSDSDWHHIYNINGYSIQYYIYHMGTNQIDLYLYKGSSLKDFKSKISIYSNNKVEVFFDVFAKPIFKESLDNLNLNTIEDLIKFYLNVSNNLAFL